jgi:phosphatidylinositol alpha-1,6-mannosyltransferase
LIFSLCATIRRERIEYVVVGQTLPVGTATAIVSFFLRIPYAVSTHGMDVALAARRPWKRFLARRILLGADRVTTISSYTARILKGYGVPGEKICFVQPCPHITPESLLPQAETRLPTRSPIILTVSRLVKRKGHETILRALPPIIDEFPRCLYAVIGEGPHRAKLEACVSELGLSDHVLFLGPLSDEHTAWWYQHCEVFAMTPTDENGDVEGFGLVYLEAGSFSKPVIGSNSGGVLDAVCDGVTGIVITQKDSTRCAIALRTLLRDSGMAHRMGAAARARIARQFTWERQAKNLQQCISR